MENTTVAAISTAQGAGGIGVIRISGKEAIQIADKVFVSVSGKKLNTLKGYTASFGHIVENNEKVDEAVALVFKSPFSYTGEDVVEISCHGGIYITKKVLRTLLNAGAKPAPAGEFTKRAFLNGKMDLTEAEAVMDIIGAKSEMAAKAALHCKEGAVSKKINTIKDMLVHSAAHLSAWADYPEEDIPQVDEDTLKASIKDAISQMNLLIKNYDIGKIIKEGIDTIIVGKPNVGKSTLMNLLSGYEKSIVTDIPGTTRDIVEETVVLGDITLRLSDTAGLRDTENIVEKIGVDKARQRINDCSLVLAMFDASVSFDDEDIKLINQVKNINCIAIVNKTDKDIKIDEELLKSKIKNVVYISAKEEKGVEELTSLVAKVTNTANFDPAADIIATERQRNCAINALEGIKEALDALEMGMTLDAVTVSLEHAIGEILELTGERASEVVVDNVFHNFCVGK